MKLIRTNVIFSRTTLVLFLCRNKSSRNALKINGDFSGKYKKYWNKNLPEGSPVGSTRVGGAPLGLVDYPWAHLLVLGANLSYKYPNLQKLT